MSYAGHHCCLLRCSGGALAQVLACCSTGSQMSNKLQQAIKAINLGDKSTGQKLLAEVLKSEPQSEDAWLWMAKVVTSVEQRKKCLEQVMKLNPDNKEAQQEMRRLQQIEGPVGQNVKTDTNLENTVHRETNDGEQSSLKKNSKATSY